MAEKKITKREMYEMLKAVPAVAENEDFVKFLDHEIELLARKNGKGGKPTATQKANEELKAVILDLMNEEKATITEITKRVNGEKDTDYTPNKISALVRQLVGEGKVERIEEKRKAYFVKIGD